MLALDPPCWRWIDNSNSDHLMKKHLPVYLSLKESEAVYYLCCECYLRILCLVAGMLLCRFLSNKRTFQAGCAQEFKASTMRPERCKEADVLGVKWVAKCYLPLSVTANSDLTTMPSKPGFTFNAEDCS